MGRITFLVLAVALGAVGVVLAVLLVIRAGRPSADRADASEGTLRVRASVHTGVEQAVIGVARSLSLAGGPGDAAYGQLYLQPVGDHGLLVGTRSEIGRGFRAAITFERRPRTTLISYAILRLPGDHALHAAVLQFELLLIEAVRRLDPDADVRLVGRALRDLDSLQLPAPDQEDPS